MRVGVLVVWVMLLVVASSAGAATVRVEVQPDPRLGGTAQVRFVASSGEANQVVAVRDGSSWVIRDSGAPLSAGSGCSALDANSARCSPDAPAAVTLELALGDGADSFQSPDGTQSARVDGGEGADVLRGGGMLAGGAGDDQLEGGTGADDLRGGPGRDILRGDSGDDVLSGDRLMSGEDAAIAEPDVLDGGTGTDTASYAMRQAPVNADLARNTGGTGLENDAYSSIESLTGGESNDALHGDDGSNVLMGESADDVLDGRGGADALRDGRGIDRLDGGPGPDVLSGVDRGDQLLGGDGDDRLDGFAGVIFDAGVGDDLLGVGAAPARIACGPGTDIVAGQNLAGPRLDDCEHVVVGAFGLLTLGARPTDLAARSASTRQRTGGLDGSNADLATPRCGTIHIRPTEGAALLQSRDFRSCRARERDRCGRAVEVSGAPGRRSARFSSCHERMVFVVVRCSPKYLASRCEATRARRVSSKGGRRVGSRAVDQAVLDSCGR